MSKDKIEVALADDHVLFRKGMVQLINNFERYKVVIEADNGQQVIQKIRETEFPPKIVILDINMPKMDGFSTCELLKKERPELNILALSMHDDERSIIKMIRSGAGGYILKDAHPKELEMALDQINSKGFYYSELMSTAMVHKLRNPESNSDEMLNDREIEFLKHTVSELTYKEIADQMSLSPRTIDGYRDSLFEKLGVKSRVGLVLYAIKNQIVSP